MAKELAKSYKPSEFEDRIYDFWMKGNYFHAEVDKDKKPYTIVMPPPNITGQLHIGHALDLTLQDTLIRWRRMQGYAALWLPGTDHASIATEAKIVEAMRKEGVTKDDLGREGFLKRAWEWKEEYGGRITRQFRKLGSSCDWQRERFTMDEGCSKAVKEVFVKLYNKGLIYRGERIINWCPHCCTSISDAEVDFAEQEGFFWHLRYPLKDGSGYVELATTRPETLLGDTAVAVNPDDERYKDIVGKTLILPLVGREIPVVADAYVEKDFGTGVVKITPAHDPNDFEVGLRHNLEVINVMDDTAHMNENAGKYQGMDRYECREAIVKDLEEGGFLVKIEPHTHNVGTCYRCKTTVEPRVSKQWFVKMEPLAKPAIKCVKEKQTQIIPERFEKVYYHWMENIKDWCISRQLWWGHRIPAWYYRPQGEAAAEGPKVGEVFVDEDLKGVMAQAKAKYPQAQLQEADFQQDDDALDTWFSSWLWPISLFDGINKPDNEEINYYFPTSDLVTGPDIIFFWVARMIMAGYEYRNDKPFKHVYFTGIVRDKLGRKMSKSLGNSPDPIELIEKYGADGVRMGMMLSAPAGNDILFDETLCEQGRNFNNKIWNAFRLVKGWEVSADAEQDEASRIATRWFESKLREAYAEMDAHFAQYRISDALMTVYRLFWDEFSSWYLEMVKPAYKDGKAQPVAQATYDATLRFFDALLRMLHPFMPFITEELWQHLADRKEGESIMVECQTVEKPTEADARLCEEFEAVKQVVAGVRSVRNQKNIAPRQQLVLQAVGTNEVDAYDAAILKMANLEKIEVVEAKAADASGFMVGKSEWAVPVGSLIDVEAELEKAKKELAHLEGFLTGVTKKLSNENFVAHAPAAVVEKERKKQADAMEKIAMVKAMIKALK